MEELNLLRNELDIIDNNILELLARRFAVTGKVGVFKAKHGLPPVDISREQAIYDSLRTKAEKFGLDQELIVSLYQMIISSVVENHKKISSENK